MGYQGHDYMITLDICSHWFNDQFNSKYTVTQLNNDIENETSKASLCSLYLWNILPFLEQNAIIR